MTTSFERIALRLRRYVTGFKENFRGYKLAVLNKKMDGMETRLRAPPVVLTGRSVSETITIAVS